jgi:hypothetical protein
MGVKRNACRILMGKPEEERPIGISRHRWVESIKMDLRYDHWYGLDCQERDFVNTVMNLQVP